MVLHAIPDTLDKSTPEAIDDWLCRLGSLIPVEEVNWVSPAVIPQVKVRMGYDNRALFLRYEVTEPGFRLAENHDNGRIWEDSCVEFFLQPDPQGGYYNLEINAGGALLLGYGTDRHRRVAAPPATLASLRRWARMEVLWEAGAPTTCWSVGIELPFPALYNHVFSPKPGDSIRANFYKCGDKTDTPHFLSWQPVGTATPDFHRPEYFGLLSFE